MGRRAGRDDERRMPNCCRALILPLAGGGAWRRWVVTTPQSSADRMPQIRSRIGSWITGSNRGSTGTGTSRTFHTGISPVYRRYIAGLACMPDSVRMVLDRQHCLAGKLVVPAFGDDEVHGPHGPL